MGLVQIEDTELAALRTERNEARAKVETLEGANRELTTKVETAEAAKVAAETAKAEADKKVKDSEEAKAATELKDKRMSALSAGFLAKLGDTSKTVLNDLAAKASDDEWETAVKEREELAKVKRDAKTDESAENNGGDGDKPGPTFESEEVASFMRRNGGAPTGAPAMSGTSAVRSLARTFSKGRTPAPAGDKS